METAKGIDEGAHDYIKRLDDLTGPTHCHLTSLKGEMMRFYILLLFIANKFKRSASAGEDFEKFLLGHECRIVIKTNDGKKGKRFLFENGGFSTDNVLDQYDSAMVWDDAAIAFNAMKKGADGIMEALQNHVVRIEGSIHDFTWFGAALNFVME